MLEPGERKVGSGGGGEVMGKTKGGKKREGESGTPHVLGSGEKLSWGFLDGFTNN